MEKWCRFVCRYAEVPSEDERQWSSGDRTLQRPFQRCSHFDHSLFDAEKQSVSFWGKNWSFFEKYFRFVWDVCGNWIEIAYGTSAGAVRVIVQHPETVGHGPQLFQTFSVHRAPVTRVALTTNHLISGELLLLELWTLLGANRTVVTGLSPINNSKSQ